MDFGKPDILKCPHCGGLRRMCGMGIDDISETRWSDGYMPDYEPTISPILRCPICKHYHFYEYSQIVGKCRTYFNSSRGYLSYELLKEALVELAPTGENEKMLRTMLLWVYNDLYWEMPNVEYPTSEFISEREYFIENVKALITLIPDDAVLCAELYREIGEFEKSTSILSQIDKEALPVWDKWKLDELIDKVRKRDSNVYLSSKDAYCNSIRYPSLECKEYVYSSIKDWDWEYIKECFNKIKSKIVGKIRERFGWYDDNEDELW